MLAMKLGQEIRLELPLELASKKAAQTCVLRLKFASKEEAAGILNIAHVIGKTRLHLYEAKNAEASFSDGQSLNQSSLNNSSLNLEQTSYPHPEELERSGQMQPEPSRLSHHASQLSAVHASSKTGQRISGNGQKSACLELASPSPFTAQRSHRAAPEILQRSNVNTSSLLTNQHQSLRPVGGMFEEQEKSCSAPWQRDRRQLAGLPDPSTAGAATRNEGQALSSGRVFDQGKAAVFDASITKKQAPSQSHPGRPQVSNPPQQAQINSFEENRKLASISEREYPPGQTYSKSRQGLSNGFLLDNRSRDYQESYGDEYESVQAHPADSQVYIQVDISSARRGDPNLSNTKSDYSSCEPTSNFIEAIGVSSHDYRSGDKQQKQGFSRKTQNSGFYPQRREAEASNNLQSRSGMGRQGLGPAVISYDGYSSIHQDQEYSQESNQFTDSVLSNSLHLGQQERAYHTQQATAFEEKLGSANISLFERMNEKEKEASVSEIYTDELAFLYPLGIFIEGRKKWAVHSERQDFEPLTTDGTHVRFWNEFAINEPFFISKEFSLWTGSSMNKLEDTCVGIRIKRNLPAPEACASIESKLDIISKTESEFNELKKEAAEFRAKLKSLIKTLNTRKPWQENYPLKFLDVEEMHLGEYATKSSSESRPLSGYRHEDPSIRKLNQQTAFNSSELEPSRRIPITGQSDHPSMRVPITKNVRSPRKISHNV